MDYTLKYYICQITMKLTHEQLIIIRLCIRYTYENYQGEALSESKNENIEQLQTINNLFLKFYDLIQKFNEEIKKDTPKIF